MCLQSAYGLTETSPICMTNTRSDSLERRTCTVGHCADHLEVHLPTVSWEWLMVALHFLFHSLRIPRLQVKVVDKEGRMVEFGEPGEAWYRSYGNMLGYWEDEAKTREAINEAGWFKSGCGHLY